MCLKKVPNTVFETVFIQLNAEKIEKVSRHEKKCSKHSQIYEHNIRESIATYCTCCDKILFQNQVRTCSLPGLNNPFQTEQVLQFEPNSSFCSPCLSALLKNKVPSTWKYNNLLTGDVPECIKNLEIAEKRMIAQIQSFMTILMLPGGQYAEKGLAVHFPLDLNEYRNQLLNLQDEHFVVLGNDQLQEQVRMMSFRNIANCKLVRNA